MEESGLAKEPARPRRATASGADLLRASGIETAFSREGPAGNRIIKIVQLPTIHAAMFVGDAADSEHTVLSGDASRTQTMLTVPTID
jgi:hypothetical protein